ncbi:MAG: hypothetical protein GY841_18285 [FCB group bacterium]|nr:hypothetical protein [FCB group bacterium]
MISANNSTAPKMRINHQATGRLRVPRIVQLSSMEADSHSSATRTAEKMAAAGRENIRFLNRHLKAYDQFLCLTPDVDNVLYLAYTITVRDDAPFTADDLRIHLAKAGIESRPNFGFVFDAEAYHLTTANDRLKAVSGTDQKSFCLACHQFLTILDLQHIIETCDSFLGRISQQAN